MNKRVLVIATAVMTTLLALVAVWQFRSVVIYVLISLALAAVPAWELPYDPPPVFGE